MRCLDENVDLLDALAGGGGALEIAAIAEERMPLERREDGDETPALDCRAGAT